MMHLWRPLLAASATALIAGCSNPDGVLSAKADDVFWVTSHGADMPVWVKGNTLSKIMLVVIHGGPAAYALYYDSPATIELQSRYGVAFWDQRDAGASAGNNNHAELSLDQMVNDLADVLRVVRFRYGSDMRVFLYAHSFGGLLATSFLVKDTNQNMVSGWIDIDGAHDYPLCNSLSRQMLIDTGLSEIAKGHHVSDWQAIVSYCQANPSNESLDIDNTTEDYSYSAETYMGVAEDGNPINVFSPAALLSVGANYLDMYYFSQGTSFLETLEPANTTAGLPRITIPSLLLWGKYDFTVPLGVGQEALGSLGSTDKSLVVFDRSGHSPMNDQTDTVNRAIVEFIERLR